MQAVQAASDALIDAAMPDIRQKVANLRQNRLDPKQWCIVVARLEAANVMGVDFVRRFSPGFVPVGSGQGFCALMQTEDALEALAAAGLPVEHGLGMQRAAATIPAGSVMVVCSVAGGVTSAVIPFAGKDLPAPDPQSNLGAIPPVGRRRWALVQANLATIAQVYGRMSADGLKPEDCSVIVVDTNSNAMGLRLIEEVEADEAFVEKLRADGRSGNALPSTSRRTSSSGP
ncbi:MAG TPA: hypothetical protein VKU41_10065 [Polyangiaceae bacterium]|nr:hypothetical protein [Polyangiaceae bacterium]